MMNALLIVGLILGVVGGIWLLVVAFKTSIWWGLGSLLIAPVALVFVIMHWQPSKKPFFIYLAGLILVIIAAVNMPELRQGMPA
jgi:uncharacterized membrane protein